jgi:hypothetical protein
MELKALSNSEIDSHFVGEPRYGGVYMNDEVATIPRDTNKVYVLNLQNSWQQGSHWVLLSCLAKRIYYFDPYGYPPTDAVTKWVERTGRECYFARIDEQTYTSEACGYFAIWVIDHLLKGMSPTAVMKLFGTPTQNEKMLQQYFRQK